MMLIRLSRPAHVCLLAVLGCAAAELANAAAASSGDAEASLKVGVSNAGSDECGTMFGLYAFIEKYLGVDPVYYWASLPDNRGLADH